MKKFRQSILNKLSVLAIRLGLRLQVVAFRGELSRLDDGMVELWGNALGIDEDGCVCSEPLCVHRFLDEDA